MSLLHRLMPGHPACEHDHADPQVHPRMNVQQRQEIVDPALFGSDLGVPDMKYASFRTNPEAFIGNRDCANHLALRTFLSFTLEGRHWVSWSASIRFTNYCRLGVQAE